MPFVDPGGNGAIPAPPANQTAIRYDAYFESPAQNISFNSSIITFTAMAPCELSPSHTYVAYIYVNGGGLSHSLLSPASGTPTTQSVSGGVVTLTYKLDLSTNSVPNFQPQNSGLETVLVAQ